MPRWGAAASQGSCSSSPAHAVESGPHGQGGTHPAPAVERLSRRNSANTASFFGKPRHAEVETWPVCKQAPGPRGFLYKGCFFQVIYFQVWSVRAIPRSETFFFFHCHQNSEKLTLETQSKHPLWCLAPGNGS